MRYVSGVLLLFCCVACVAGTVIDSDQPGVLYALSTSPPGRVTLELGLPNAAVRHGGGTESDLVAVNGLARIGVAQGWEVRASTGYNVQYVREPSGNRRQVGVSDLAFGFKYAARPLRALEGMRFTLVSMLSVPTGVRPFGGGRPLWSVDGQAVWSGDGGWNLGVLAGVSRPAEGNPGDADTLFGGSWGFTLAPRTFSYVQIIHRRALPSGGHATLVGTGVAWLPSDAVQLDAYVNRRVLGSGAEWLFGTGVSMLL